MTFQNLKKTLTLVALSVFILSTGLIRNAAAFAVTHTGGQVVVVQQRRPERWERERLRREEREEMVQIRQMDRDHRLRYRMNNRVRVVGYFDQSGNFQQIGYYDRWGYFHKY